MNLVRSLVSKVRVVNQQVPYLVQKKYIALSSTLLERLFTEKHEWVDVNGKTGVVGISFYAQDALGDVVFLQLPEVGTVLAQKDECGSLESVKAVSEIYSPVSGKVTEKNDELEKTPSLVNKSPYEKGWLFKIELSNLDEISKLMNEEQYKNFLKSEQSQSL